MRDPIEGSSLSSSTDSRHPGTTTILSQEWVDKLTTAPPEGSASRYPGARSLHDFSGPLELCLELLALLRPFLELAPAVGTR